MFKISYVWIFRPSEFYVFRIYTVDKILETKVLFLFRNLRLIWKFHPSPYLYWRNKYFFKLPSEFTSSVFILSIKIIRWNFRLRWNFRRSINTANCLAFTYTWNRAILKIKHALILYIQIKHINTWLNAITKIKYYSSVY